MSRRAAVRVDHLADILLDRPGVFLRAERRFWADGTSCLNICKWAVQPRRGRLPGSGRSTARSGGRSLGPSWRPGRRRAQLPAPAVIGLDTDTTCFVVEQSESGDFEQVQKHWRRLDGTLDRFRQGGSQYAYQRLPLPKAVVPRVIEQRRAALQTYLAQRGERCLLTSNPLPRLSHCPTEAGRRGAEAAVKRLARRSAGAFDLPLLGGKRVACRRTETGFRIGGRRISLKTVRRACNLLFSVRQVKLARLTGVVESSSAIAALICHFLQDQVVAVREEGWALCLVERPRVAADRTATYRVEVVAGTDQ